MPQPNAGDVHVNTPLTNISIAFLQNQRNFIADQVFPVLPSLKQSDRYFEYPRGDWFRSNAQKRAPASESAGSGWNIDNTANFFCDVFSVHKDVDDQIRTNADAAINLDRDATEFVTQQQLIKRDKEFVSAFFGTSIWSTDFTPGTLWSAGGSTPIEDIRAQIFNVASSTGFRPNTMVMGADVWQVLQDHPQFIERIQFGTPGRPALVSQDLIASSLELDRVAVAMAVENTAAEGATDAIDFLVPAKSALLVYSNPRPSLLTPSAGYIFTWTGLLGAGGALGGRMKRFRMEHLASDRVEMDAAYDMKLVAADLGVFFSNAVA